MRKIIVFLGVLLFMLMPVALLQAQTTSDSVASSSDTSLLQDKVEIVKAQVTRIVSNQVETVPGTDTTSIFQSIEAKVLQGSEINQTVNVDNDYISLKQGEVFYLMITTRAEDGEVVYAVKDPDRLPSIYFYTALFVIVVIIFGGLQGVRGLVSLAGSFALILYVLLPAILHGLSPALVSIGVAALIIIVGSYVTHGFNKTTTAAVIGMIITVIFIGGLAYFAVSGTRLTGYNTEEAVYLNFDTKGSIDFAGLLLGGILIGLLGVLYDSAISQAIAVEELHHIAPHLGRAYIFKRALRIGREHIGALVNTLAIAYVGASLPLLLLFYTSTDSLALTVNQEIFATEIIRTLIGSIGLVLAVPITTFLAVIILVKPKKDTQEDILKHEQHQLEHYEHHH